MLRKMCLEHKRLPPSYAITDELKWIGDYPYGGGGNADVWRGVYRGSGVAIKVLRVNSRNLARLEKVRRFIPVLFNKNAADADESGIGIFSRSGPMEATQTPKSITVGRSEILPTKPGDDFRVDGTRYYRGLRRCVSWDQPAQTGECFVQGLKPPPIGVAFSVGGCRSWAEIPARLAIRARRPQKCKLDLRAFHLTAI